MNFDRFEVTSITFQHDSAFCLSCKSRLRGRSAWQAMLPGAWCLTPQFPGKFSADDCLAVSIGCPLDLKNTASSSRDF